MLDAQSRISYAEWADHFEPHPANGNGKAAAVAETKAVPQFTGPNTARLWEFSGFPVVDPEVITREVAFSAAVLCYVAIDYRARTVSEPPLIVTRRADDGWEQVAHRLDPLLEQPSEDQDMGELVYLSQAWEDLYGSALWLKEENNAGSVGRLTGLSGDEFTIEMDRETGRVLGRYVLNVAMGKRVWMPEEVILFKNANPYNRHIGASPTDVALSWLNLSNVVRQTVKSLVANAMFPGGVVSTPDWAPSDDEYQRFKDAVLGYTSLKRKGEPLVLEGGATYGSTAFRLRDLLPDEIFDRIEATVAAAYRIPPVVLSFLVGLRNSPWSQMSEARRMTYEDTIEPLWRERSKRLTRQLLRPMDGDRNRRIEFDTSDVRALQADDLRRAEIAEKNADIWKVDERRMFTGKDPLGGEEGERIGTPMQLSPFAPPPVAEPKLLPIRLETKSDLVWLSFDFATKAAESTWESVVAAELNGQKKQVLALARKTLGTGELTASAVAAFISALGTLVDKTIVKQLADRLEGLVRSTGATAVRKLAGEIDVTFSLLQRGLGDYVAEETAFLAGAMGKTLGEGVAATVQRGLDAGDLLRDLTERLEQDHAFSRNRAKLVARTETTRAWNGAQRRSMSEYSDESGRAVLKTWLSARDARVRDEHVRLDGTQLKIDERFANGLTEPGEPNCILPGQLVAGSFVGGVRSHYRGDTVTVRTARGRRLTVTAQHPIPTARGMLPAHEIREGDKLLSQSRDIERLGPHEHRPPAPVGEVFRTLAEKVPSTQREAAVEDLHGEGRFVHGDVHVVRPDGILAVRTDAEGRELIYQLCLVPALMEQPLVSRLGPLDLRRDRVRASSTSFPGRAALPPHGLGIGLQASPFDPFRLGPTTVLDPVLRQAAHDCRAANPVLLREGETAHSGPVSRSDLFRGERDVIAADEVLQVEASSYSGPVFDLQTTSGLMIAAGVVISNCRCTLLYAIAEPKDD